MRIGVLIEARTGSKRLPGKVLKDIGGQSMIHRVYKRCEKALSPDIVAVLMPDNDYSLFNHCNNYGLKSAMAPLACVGNVMKEIYTGACVYELDMIVEVTGDCPWIDPGMIDAVIDLAQEEPIPHWCGFVSIKGMEVRVFWKAALKVALDAMHGWERNGSTIFNDRPFWDIRYHPCVGQKHGMARTVNYSVDTEEDLEFARELYRRLPWDATLDQILNKVASDGTLLRQRLAYTSSQTQGQTTAAVSTSPSDSSEPPAPQEPTPSSSSSSDGKTSSETQSDKTSDSN